MHIKTKGYLTPEDVQKKCDVDQMENLCMNENNEKVCPTNRDLLKKANEDLKHQDAFKSLKAKYDS